MAFAKSIEIHEVGPREGFQFEGIGRPTAISTRDKVHLIECLSNTGLKTIQVASFVSPKVVPQMADAEEICAQLPARDGVRFTAVYLNEKGLQRAIEVDSVAISGKLTLTASEAFAKRNQNRSMAEDYAMQARLMQIYEVHGIPVEAGSIMAAFGCNYQGHIPLETVLKLAADLQVLARAGGGRLKRLILADTMGWANPESVCQMIDALRSQWPEIRIGLHLHDTRGLGIANVYAALRSGIDLFDTAVGGLGGCPFAGHTGAAGNVCTEEVVFLCQQLGIDTGVDLEAIVSCAREAERVIGHELPSRLVRSGTKPLGAFV